MRVVCEKGTENGMGPGPGLPAGRDWADFSKGGPGRSRATLVRAPSNSKCLPPVLAYFDARLIYFI